MSIAVVNGAWVAAVWLPATLGVSSGGAPTAVARPELRLAGAMDGMGAAGAVGGLASVCRNITDTVRPCTSAGRTQCLVRFAA